MSDSHLLSKNNIIPTDYQKPLVSGTDIKTVNSNSLLGSGNISLQEPITGAATTITSSDLTASKALVSDTNGKVAVSTTTSAEVGYLSGVTSAIQTQLDNRVTLDTAQTITNIKTFSSGMLQAKDPLLLKQNNANEGGQINFQRSDNSVLKSDPYIDLNINKIRVIGTSSQNATNIALQVDLENDTVNVATPTDTTSTSSTQAATVGWCNTRKQDTITGGASTITSSDLTASRALVSNSSGKVAVSSVTSTELGYVSGVTSAIQTQLNDKQATLVSGNNIKTINSNSLLGSGDITIASGANPVGTVIIWTTSTAPSGYLICDGSAVSRTTYSALFAVIGTTYGVGNGSSTFNLPNLSSLYLLNGRNVNTPAQNCRGNGKALGLTAGGSGINGNAALSGHAYYSTLLNLSNAGYGKAYGTASQTVSGCTSGTLYGVTTDSNYSGIMRDAVTSTISNYVQFNAIIKY